MANITLEGPQYAGGDLATWAVEIRLPWLVERLGLTAGAICGSVPEPVRRKVLGLGEGESLPPVIDWRRNSIVISPPGTGKGMAVFVDALAHFRRVLTALPAHIHRPRPAGSCSLLYLRNHRGLAGEVAAHCSA